VRYCLTPSTTAHPVHVNSTHSLTPHTTSTNVAPGDFFFNNLRQHAPQRPRVRPAAIPTNIVHEQLHRFLLHELEDDTWRAYGRTFAEIETFLQHHALHLNGHSVSLWLVSLVNDHHRKIGISTIYNYAKQISAICHRDPDFEDGPLMRVLRILRNMGGALADSPAVPVTKEEVYGMLEDKHIPHADRMLIYIGWKMAARAADLRALHLPDCVWVIEQDRPLWVARWIPSSRQGPGHGRLKAARGIPKAIVVDFAERTQEAAHFLRGRVWLTSKSTEQIAALMQRIRPQLSAHSIKRGALHHLLQHPDIALDLLTRVARHRHPAWELPIHTTGYLPPVQLALRLDTQKATRLL
jgi:hypothetical protein